MTDLYTPADVPMLRRVAAEWRESAAVYERFAARFPNLAAEYRLTAEDAHQCAALCDATADALEQAEVT